MDASFFGGSFDKVDLPEVNEIPDALEGSALEPVIYETPEAGEVLVYGDPFEIGQSLDDMQGDNIYNAGGDCGLVTVTNMLRMAGVEVTEDEVVGNAINMGLCQYSEFNNPEDNGGTTAFDRQSLLRLYGINASIYEDKNGDASLDSIADYVESGHGVNISINAGYAWDDPSFIGDGSSNHSITVTGTARDPETGELKGLYVCDSGLTDCDSSAMFLSVDTLQECYIDTYGSTVLVTNDEIR